MSRPAPIGELNFPEEWIGDLSWALVEVVATGKTDDGRVFFIAGGVLEDGTNLMGLGYPGGQRLVRMSPDTDWAIEERFAGKPLAEGDALLPMWRHVLQAAIEGKSAAQDEEAA